MSQTTRKQDSESSGAEPSSGFMVGIALRFTRWAENWFPDAYVFAAIALVVVAGSAC